MDDKCAFSSDDVVGIAGQDVDRIDLRHDCLDGHLIVIIKIGLIFVGLFLDNLFFILLRHILFLLFFALLLLLNINFHAYLIVVISKGFQILGVFVNQSQRDDVANNWRMDICLVGSQFGVEYYLAQVIFVVVVCCYQDFFVGFAKETIDAEYFCWGDVYGVGLPCHYVFVLCVLSWKLSWFCTWLDFKSVAGFVRQSLEDEVDGDVLLESSSSLLTHFFKVRVVFGWNRLTSLLLLDSWRLADINHHGLLTLPGFEILTGL